MISPLGHFTRQGLDLFRHLQNPQILQRNDWCVDTDKNYHMLTENGEHLLFE